MTQNLDSLIAALEKADADRAVARKALGDALFRPGSMDKEGSCAICGKRFGKSIFRYHTARRVVCIRCVDRNRQALDLLSY